MISKGTLIEVPKTGCREDGVLRAVCRRRFGAFSRELPPERVFPTRTRRHGRRYRAKSSAEFLRTAGGTAEAWSFVPYQDGGLYFFVL